MVEFFATMNGNNGLGGLNDINGVDGLDILKGSGTFQEIRQNQEARLNTVGQSQRQAHGHTFAPNPTKLSNQCKLPAFNPHKNLKPSRDFPNNPSPPVYKDNPVMEGFKQPGDGFGLSNFRVEEALPDSINRTNRDFQFEITRQWTNPIAEQAYNRHSNFLFREHYGDYDLIEQEEVSDDYIYWDIIKNFQERNPLIDFFFSRKNLNHLQNLLIQMVWHQSDRQYKLTRQKDYELLTIMRSIYIQTPTNPYAQGDAFKQEVCKLNKNVLDWAVPRILVNVQGYLGYVRDQGNTVMPPERAQFMSSTGTRVNRGFDFNFV
jgi:hypothetical protein